MSAPAPALRVLYVGMLGPTDSALHRRWAIERIGNEVVEFDARPYVQRGGRIVRSLRGRALVGRAVNDLNRELLAAAIRHRPDLVWFDKASFVRPRTVRALRERGLFTVHFNIDNPFGPRRDPGRRLVLASVPEYDLHLVQRDVNLADYHRAGARDVQLLRTAYEPSLHFPPPDGWSDKDRVNDVIYMGAPYDDRAQFVLELWRRHGIAVRLWGSLWKKAVPAEALAALWQGDEQWNDDYRRTMWRSRICLAWVTHSNCDDVAHKSFEIAACGAFMLAEDAPGHRAHFAADEEAVFFRSVDDCAALIRRYLPDESARERISRAGQARAERSGYGNDARLQKAFAYIRTRLAARAGAPQGEDES